MSVSYDVFTEAFLAKVNEYEFMKMDFTDRQDIVDGYLHRAVTAFKKNCKYDLSGKDSKRGRRFNVDVEPEDLDELVEIISDGMVVQWLKPYANQELNLINALNTRDFTTYSPAELLKQVTAAYRTARQDYVNAIREYSYNHGDLKELHN